MYHPMAFGALVRVEVTLAINDWQVLHQHRIRLFEQGDHRGVDPHSDSARTKLFQDLEKVRGLNVAPWSTEEVLMFVQIAFPRKILRAATQAAQQPLFLKYLFRVWRPSLFEWLSFLWGISGHACEFFADMLYILPDEQCANHREMIRQLFRWLPYRKLYSEWTCVSIAAALVPFSKSQSCARLHADYIRHGLLILPPYNIGLIVRSLIIAQAQPIDCKCGYQVNDAHCRCIHPDTRKRTALNLDSPQVYAIVLLRLVMEHLHNIPSFHPEWKPWTIRMRDQMIQSACEYVFTEHAYIIIYRAVTRSKSMPVDLLKHPRKTFDPSNPHNPHHDDFLMHHNHKEDAEEFRNTQLDFDNSAAQTGSCIVASCKQLAKDNCANVACALHCKEYFLECRQHRHYPELRTYRPRRYVNKLISQDGTERKIEPRDHTTI